MADLRVVELCGEVGQFAGKMFADMGADVIKVEPPGGAGTRRYPPFVNDEPHPERSLHFWHYNTSKRSITLDLERDAGREAFRTLVASADVLFEDQPPGRMAELGLAYDDLRPANERLIHAAITPWGQAGDPERPFTDLTVLAASGPVWSCGYDDHSLPPVRGGGNQGYQTGCHWAVISTLTALLYRDQGGSGQFIDVSLHAASNVTTEAASYSWLVGQLTVQRQTGRHASVKPTATAQIESAPNRYVTSGTLPRRASQIARVVEWLHTTNLYDKFDQAPLLDIAANREQDINLSILEEDEQEAALATAARDAMNFMAENLPPYDYFTGAQERGIQVGIIYAPEDVIEDPHFVARGFPTQVEHPELGKTFTYPGAPYQFRSSPWSISRRAPLIGEHNDEVFAELGIEAGAVT